MKKIVIFGSTGTTGLSAVEAALKKGLEVRAFLRDPSKLPEGLQKKVQIFQGDVLEPDSVANAVDGVDGVVVTLGTRNSLEPTSDLSEGMKNILEAMRAKNVKNVTVCLSAFLFYEPDKLPPKFIPLTDDHRRMYEALKATSLNWVAVYPRTFPMVSEETVIRLAGDCLGIRAGRSPDDEPGREMIIQLNQKTPGRSISKWDLGALMIDALSDPKYYRNIVSVCNVPTQ